MCSCKKPVVKFCFRTARFSWASSFLTLEKEGSFSKRGLLSEIHKAHCWASLALQNLKEGSCLSLKQSHEGLMLPFDESQAGAEDEGNR